MKTETKGTKALLVAVNAKYVHTNIAVRYLKRYAEMCGVSCDFCELTINEPRSRAQEKLYMSDADLYGFSCYIWNIDYVLMLCECLKRVKPECKIFLGGPEVSYDAAELLRKYNFIDAVVVGEGEKAVCELIRAFPRERCVVYGEAVCDMNELPFPYSDEDLQAATRGGKLIYYETSRGCPFSCSYCLSSVESGVRFLALDRVKEELARICRFGAQTIKFVDRTFNADKKRAKEIWRYCLSLEGDTCFHFEIGADLLDSESIDILSLAPKGKIQLEIGVQTTNEKTLSAVSRKMDMERLRANVAALRENTSVHAHLDLIAGLPYEDYGSFRKSFNDVYNMRPDVLQLGFLKLLKGSGLRKAADSYKMIYSPRAPYEIYSTEWISYPEIIRLKGIEDVLERYFNSGRFEKTLSAVLGYFDSPIDFYEELGGFWEERGLVGQGVKRIALYNLLYEFLNVRLGEAELGRVMREMKRDYSLWHSNGVGTPEWYKMY